MWPAPPAKIPNYIVIAGIAGLLAGGFSMAVGEYISVQSQRELLDYQIDLQRHKLHHTLQQEHDMLCEIYESKGLSPAESELIVQKIMRDPERTTDTFVREEIGLSAETMGSPVAAGAGSMSAFSVGAMVPLIPFLLTTGGAASTVSIAASVAALRCRARAPGSGGRVRMPLPACLDTAFRAFNVMPA